LFQSFFELVQAFELTVHAGKSNIGNLVSLGELSQYQITDSTGVHFGTTLVIVLILI
jgi:hypothetical protein